MKCPECGSMIELDHSSLNGEPITIIKCDCGYMRIKGGHLQDNEI